MTARPDFKSLRLSAPTLRRPRGGEVANAATALIQTLNLSTLKPKLKPETLNLAKQTKTKILMFSVAGLGTKPIGATLVIQASLPGLRSAFKVLSLILSSSFHDMKIHENVFLRGASLQFCSKSSSGVHFCSRASCGRGAPAHFAPKLSFRVQRPRTSSGMERRPKRKKQGRGETKINKKGRKDSTRLLSGPTSPS